jgi:hypothetical protein
MIPYDLGTLLLPEAFSEQDVLAALKSFPRRPAEVLQYQLALMQLQPLMDVITTARHHHISLAQCMAQRKTSLPHKGHCCMRQMRLENSTWGLTAQFAQLFFSFSNDRGTEKGFKKVHYPNLNEFAEWREPHIRVDDGLDGLLEEDDIVDPVCSLRQILDISGMFIHRPKTYLFLLCV